ncbi:hypothetical protein BsWGS_25356 [Bradybaena similaris]
MASGNSAHLAIPAAVILLIQTYVCFLNADQRYVVLNVAGTEIKLGSSQLKSINKCLCNRDYELCDFKYTRNSTDLNIQNIITHKRNGLVNRNITCGFSILKKAESIICNLTNTYWEHGVEQMAGMQVACANSCVPMLWIGAKVVKVSSEYLDKCADSTSTAVTPKSSLSTDIISTTTSTCTASRRVGFPSTDQQPTSFASQEQSISTTVSVSHGQTMSSSNIAIIIAVIVVAVILLGLGIVLFLRKRKKRKCRLTISHGNPDLQEDRQHLSQSVECTPSAGASLLSGDYAVVSDRVCLEECNSASVYSRLREQPSLTTDTYGTLANTTKDPDVNACTKTTNSSQITSIRSSSQIIPAEEIRNTPAASQIEMLSTEAGAYSAVNLAIDDIKEQTRGTSQFTNFKLSDANNDHTNVIIENKVPPTENPVYSVAVKKVRSNSENLDGKLDAISGGPISDYKQSNKSDTNANVKLSRESHL